VFAAAGAQPLFKGVPGKVPFPAASCISVNEEVVHGLPGERVIEAGDLVSVDTGCRLEGWCADSAWTFPAGLLDGNDPESELKRRLLACGRSVLMTAIAAVAVKERWSDVAALMEQEVKDAGFSVVEEFVGHGIGREMHEDPQVPNYVSKSLRRNDFRLEPGLVLAIEPMVNAGSKHTQVSRRDYWTVTTRDRRPSVHFEHTIARTADGVEILTGPESSPNLAPPT
jgi:methionyl aminopeptidase